MGSGSLGVCYFRFHFILIGNGGKSIKGIFITSGPNLWFLGFAFLGASQLGPDFIFRKLEKGFIGS